jgi:hypothetical protein
MVPNFLKVFAHSPTILRAFLGLRKVASEGSLDPLTRERITLGLAEQNACEISVLREEEGRGGSIAVQDQPPRATH